MGFKLYFVRHGATPWNEEQRYQGRLPGIGLSAKGREQVGALAKSLDFNGFSAVISSPLQRAIETANILKGELGLEAQIIADESFSEWNIPAWNRMTLAEIASRFPEAYRTLADDPVRLSVPGGETLRDVRARTLAAVRSLQNRYPDEAVLVVTHAAVANVAMSGLLEIPLLLYRRFPIANASLTVIEVPGNETSACPTLQLYNWHPYKLT